MNQQQAKRIVAAYVAGLLVSAEAFAFVDVSESDRDRLNKAVDDLCDEMLRRSGRDNIRTATLDGLIADELAGVR